MKKWMAFFCLLAACSPQAGAWGLVLNIGDKSTLLFQYLGQQQVEQPVCVRTYAAGDFLPGLPADSRVTQEQLVVQMEKGLNYWFTKSREFVQQKGRAEEFSDVLAVLPQQVSLRLKEDCTAPHTLNIVYAPRPWYIHVQEQDGHVVAVTHKARYTVPQIRVSDEKAWTETSHNSATVHIYERLDLINLPQVLTHEAGHLLGLTDQYGFAPYLTPGENTSSYFAYAQVVGRNTQTLNNTLRLRKPASLMGATRYHAQALQTMWPDDFDGLVNAVDFVQVYHKGQLSPRVVNGWKSFSLADKHIGYALAVPFQYTPQQAVPDELLARATAYTPAIGGLKQPDLLLLQSWYAQTGASNTYAQVNAADLHNWQAGELARRELTRQSFGRLEPVRGVSLRPASIPAASVPLPDLIQLRLPDEAGQPRALAVSQTVAPDDPDCNFYLIVTDKEMSWFHQEYDRTLNRARSKSAAGKKLTRKETRITRWYAQMQENQRKTAKCQRVVTP